MAIRSALSERINRLERYRLRGSAGMLTKEQRDEKVRNFLAQGDFAAMLASETEPHRRAAIQAAARAVT